MAEILTIAGAIQTAHLRLDTLKIEQAAGEFTAVCSFTLTDLDSTIDILTRATVTVIDDSTDPDTVLFAGEVVNVDATMISTATIGRWLAVVCQDYQILVEEAIVDGVISFPAQADSAILDTLFGHYRPDIDAIDYVSTIQGDLAISFEDVTLRQALADICGRTGGRWYVDELKNLHYFAAEANVAAWHLSDTPGVGAYGYQSIARRLDAPSIVNQLLIVGSEVRDWFEEPASRILYGDHPAIIKDDRITTAAGLQERADALFARWALPHIMYTVITRKEGLRAGMDIRLVCSAWTLDTTLTVRRLTIYWKGGKRFYRLEIGEGIASVLTTGRIWMDRISEAESSLYYVYNKLFDTDAPAAPALETVNLSTGVDLDADGHQQVWFQVTWGLVADTDLSFYAVQIGTTVNFAGYTITRNHPASGDRMERFAPVLGNTLYYARVRAVDWVGNVSAWSTIRSVTTSKDAAAPGAPAGLTATATPMSVHLLWTANAEADLRHYEIQRKPDGGVYATIATVSLNFFIDNTVVAGTAYWYQVRAVDTSGNASAYTAIPGAVTPATVSGGWTDLGLLGWTHNLVFSVVDHDTVAWAAGDINLPSGATYHIDLGDTGDIAAVTYVYLDTAISITILQKTDTASVATGAHKLLVAVCQNVAAGYLATYLVFGSLGAGMLVNTANIADDAITNAKIGALAVDTAELAAKAVETAKINDLAVTAAQIAAATITGGKLVAHTITANEIAALTITAAEIAAGTITGAKIAATTIEAANIAALTITAAEIAALTITGAKIVAATITGAKIAAATIAAGNIVANTITAGQIAAATITTNEIAANTIVAGNIAAGTITGTEIAAITITAANIAATTITGAKIAATTITADKMNVAQLSAIAADLGTMTAGIVTGATIRTAAVGARIVLDSTDGIQVYNAGGSQTISILPSGAGWIGITDQIAWNTVGGVTIAGGLLVDGTIDATKFAVGMGQDVFTSLDGLLLLGPNDAITTTAWTSRRGQVATLSGAFHQVTGRWAGTRALMVEATGVNYELAPRMIDVGADGTADGWGYYDNLDGSATLSVVAHPVTERGWMQRLVYGGSAGNVDALAMFYDATAVASFVGGEPCTASFDIYGSSSGVVVRLQLQFLSNVDGYLGQACSDPVVLTSSVQRIQLTYASLPVNTDHIQIALHVSGVDYRGSFDVSFGAVAIYKGPYSSSFICGALPYCSWSGSADASTSIMYATEVNLDTYASLLSDSNTWSMSLWWQPQYGAASDWPDEAVLFDVRGANERNQVWIRFEDDDSKYDVVINNTWTESSAQTFNAGEWQHILLTLDFTTDAYILYINGVVSGSDNTALTAPTALAQMNLGSRYDGSNQANAAYSEFAIFNRVLTAEEVAALYHRNAPLADAGAMDTPGVYILDGKFSLASSTSGARTEINPTGWWAYDTTPAAVFGLALQDGIAWDGGTLNIGDLKIGRAAANYILWDASAGTITMKGSITIVGGSGIASLTDAGDLATVDDLDGVPNGATYGRIANTIIAAGLIQVGAGTKDVDLDGFHISAAEIVGQANGVDQTVMGVTGDLRAGAGNVILDANGISIASGSGTANKIRWYSGGVLAGYQSNYVSDIYLRSEMGAGIAADTPGMVTLVALGDGASNYVQLNLVGGDGANGPRIDIINGYFNMTTVTGPATPPAGTVRLYVGSLGGTVRALIAKFSDGTYDVIAQGG